MRRLLGAILIAAALSTGVAQAAVAPPVLSATGDTLHWTAVPRATEYRLRDVSTGKSYYLPSSVLSYAASTGMWRVKSRPPVWSGWSNEVTPVEEPKEEPNAGVEKEACEAFIAAEHGPPGNFTPPGPGSCGGRQVPLECELQECN